MGTHEVIHVENEAFEINELGEPARIRLGPVERLCDDICGVRVSLRSPGMAARRWVEIMTSDAAHLADLADDAYTSFGTKGERRWNTMRGELAIVIRADGRGHFQFFVTLAQLEALDREHATSSASLAADLETAQLPRLAAAIRSLFSSLR